MIPAQRLHPLDLHHQLDWLQDVWESEHEQSMTRRLHRLRSDLEQLPAGIRDRALAVWRELYRARLVETSAWRSLVVALRMIVNEWRPTQ